MRAVVRLVHAMMLGTLSQVDSMTDYVKFSLELRPQSSHVLESAVGAHGRVFGFVLVAGAAFHATGRHDSVVRPAQRLTPDTLNPPPDAPFGSPASLVDEPATRRKFRLRTGQ